MVSGASGASLYRTPSEDDFVQFQAKILEEKRQEKTGSPVAGATQAAQRALDSKNLKRPATHSMGDGTACIVVAAGLLAIPLSVAIGALLVKKGF